MSVGCKATSAAECTHRFSLGLLLITGRCITRKIDRELFQIRTRHSLEQVARWSRLATAVPSWPHCSTTITVLQASAWSLLDEKYFFDAHRRTVIKSSVPVNYNILKNSVKAVKAIDVIKAAQVTESSKESKSTTSAISKCPTKTAGEYWCLEKEVLDIQWD